MGYVLGIDSGGTKTLCLIADTSGTIHGMGIAGPSNYLTTGLKKTKEALAEAISKAVSRSGLHASHIDSAFFGLAGVDLFSQPPVILKMIRGVVSAERIGINNDSLAALYGANAGKPGVIVIAGTGVMALGMNSRSEWRRSSGWGHILGDEGSGYDIGRKGIIAAIRAHDGRGESTSLLAKIKDHYNIRDIEELIPITYLRKLERQEIAAVSMIVAQAAREGDAVSRQLLSEAGREIALAVAAVVRGLQMDSGEAEVFPVGGVFRAGSLVMAPFSETLREKAPQARILPPRCHPAVGALILALEQAGVRITGDILQRLDSSAASDGLGQPPAEWASGVGVPTAG